MNPYLTPLPVSVRQPIVISFYTPEYTKLAERMRLSVESFGFKHDITPVQKIDNNWRKTIYWRAEFVKMMLEKHHHDVLWIDSDAVMRQYPALFDNFPADFGAHWASFKWAPHELLGGTMYFAYNLRTLALVNAWIRANQEHPNETLSQRVLQPVVERFIAEGKITAIELPSTYTHIFDFMAGLGSPVIEHLQASRQFRGAT